MENLKDLVNECIGHVDRSRILSIDLSYDDDDRDTINVFLPINGDIIEFMNKIDFQIDPLWKGLDCTVWYTDGSWSTYDITYDVYYGYWYYHKCPKLPEHLNKELV
jgi:hypothetical protein